MSAWVDKLLHFATGLGVGITFWWLLERHLRIAARRINPIIFLIMLMWGASGLFFFRKLGIPILSHTAFYMAVPDWDLPLYQATRLRFLIHRSWLFHSTLLPLALFRIMAVAEAIAIPSSMADSAHEQLTRWCTWPLGWHECSPALGCSTLFYSSRLLYSGFRQSELMALAHDEPGLGHWYPLAHRSGYPQH